MKRRTGFTLVELLVVIGILVALTLLVLAFYPKREVRSTNDAVGNLQYFIAGAKARALKENRPVGVRFLSDDGNRTFNAVQLIDQDSVWTPFDRAAYNNSSAPLTIYLDLPAGNLIQSANQNNNPNPVGNIARQVGAPLQGNVEVGDMLEIVEVTQSMHKIIAIDYATNTMTLNASKEAIDDDGDGIIDRWFVSGIPNVSSTGAARIGWNYRYHRRPRPLMGEQPYQLPRDVFIRGASGVIPTSLNIPVGPTGDYEVVFSPSGQVLNAPGNRIVLWIADTNNVAKPELLVIYSNTGACASHPVGPTGDEFRFTYDGRSSGQ